MFHAEGEGFGLETDGAQAEPLIVDHLFHEDGFQGGGRLEFIEKGGLESVEIFRIFAVEEMGGGCEAVGDGVAGGFSFAFGGGRAGGLLGVGAIGCDLGFGGHGSLLAVC